MWQKIKALREERGQFLKDMKTLLKKADDEKRALTAEEETQFNDLNTKAEQRKADIERYETAARIEGELADKGKPNEQRVGRDELQNPNEPQEQRTPEEQAVEYRTAFNDWARTGELRATNTITTTTGSGAYVPKDVAPLESVAKLGNSLKSAMAYYGIPAIPVSGKVVVSVPVIDMGDGATVDGDEDTEQLGSKTDSSVTLTVATYNSKPQWLDNGIVSAQDYDAAGALVPVLRVACERGQEAAFYTASIMTAGLQSAARETATASTVEYGDLSALLFDLGAYAVGRCAYLVSMSMLSRMHSLTDDNGYPINKLTRDPNGVFHWDGVPVFPTTALQAIDDDNFVAAAINVDAARVAASTPWVQRYDQNSSKPNQIGFDYLQYGAFGIKSGAVKLLKVKAAG